MSTDLVWAKSSYSGSEGECVEVALEWSKSSYSGDQGECLEVALEWSKSSYSGGQGGECLEVAVALVPTPATVHVRDSKTPATPHLTLSPTAWTTFVHSPLLRAHSRPLAKES